MTSFLELVTRRYSVRKYVPRAVEASKIDYLLECARLAPSAVNRQPWRFIVVRQAASREALHQCYAREWFKEAPLYIVLCADEHQSWKRSFDGRDHGDIDVAIAAEHICLAAAEQGLGSCWVCNFDPEACRRALQLPDEVHPVVIIPVGYAADSPTEKQRRPLHELVENR